MTRNGTSYGNIRDFETYLKLLTKYDKTHKVCCQAFKEDRTSASNYFFDNVDNYKEIFSRLARDNKKQYCCSVTLHELGTTARKAANLTRVRCLSVDFDAYLYIDVYNKLVDLYEPTIVNVTSKHENKDKYKAHFYWVFANNSPEFEESLKENLKVLQLVIAHKFDDLLNSKLQTSSAQYTDKQLTHGAVMLRAPGLYHQKKEKFLVTLTHKDSYSYLTEEKFRQLFHKLEIDEDYIEKHRKLSTVVSLTDDTDDPLVSSYIGAEKGNRNNVLYNYVYNDLFVYKQLTKHEALGAALYEDKEKNNPPLQDENERIVESIVESAFKAYIDNLDGKALDRIKKGDSFSAKKMFDTYLEAASKGDNNAQQKRYKYDYSDTAKFDPLISDESMLCRFEQRFGGKYKTSKSLGVWGYDKEDGTWKDKEKQAREDILKVHDDVLCEKGTIDYFRTGKKRLVDKSKLENFKNKLKSTDTLKKYLQALQIRNSLHLDPAVFDTNPNLINTKSGVLDLESGSLISHDPAYYMTKSLNVTYPGTELVHKCLNLNTSEDWLNMNRWTKFIYEIMSEDLDMCLCLQQLLGYCLNGNNSEQILIFLHGTGKNGKSTFMEQVLYMFGTYGATAPNEIFLKQHSSSLIKMSALANLMGCRLAISGELDIGEYWNESTVKDLTGQDQIYAKFYHKDGFYYEPQFTLMIRGNHKPILRGGDLGIWRRLFQVPFDRQFHDKERDDSLRELFRTEEYTQIIFAWAVAGHILWKQNGLIQPDRVIEDKDEYESEMNPVKSFLEECFLPVEFEQGATIGDLLAAYNVWRVNNNAEKYEKVPFAKKLTSQGIRSKIIKDGGFTVKLYPFKPKDEWEERIVTEKKNKVSHLF